MPWRIPAPHLSGGGVKRDTLGVRRSEAGQEVLPVVRNAVKKSWKQKDSGTSKTRENTIDHTAIGEEGMDYRCDDCGFLFRRVSGIHVCPSCEAPNFRPATKSEGDQLENLLKKKSNPICVLSWR